MKYQLFNQVPTEEFIITLLKCYGISSICDTKEFSKCDLIDLETINQIEDLIPDLVLLYMPCKYNMFLNNITINKSITILRQILRLFNYKLKKREHVHNKKKKIYYHIKEINNNNIKIENNINKCILKFN